MWLALMILAQAWLPPWLPPWLRGDGDASVSADERTVVLWYAGDVVQRPLPAPFTGPSDAAPTRLTIGASLDAERELTLGDGARLRLLAEGNRLVTLSGPSSVVFSGGKLDVRAGPRAHIDVLDTYREGAPPQLGPGTSYPPAEVPPSARTLRILSPGWSVVRDASPTFRWRWGAPGSDARFDLEVAAIGADGEVEVIESWRGLTGRAHAVYAPLERGRRYRCTVEVGGARGWFDDEARDSVEFSVLSEVELRAVRGALASLRALQARSDALRPEFEVLRARLLESHGLLTDAEAVWSALSMMYPQYPELRHHARRLFHRSSGP